MVSTAVVDWQQYMKRHEYLQSVVVAEVLVAMDEAEMAVDVMLKEKMHLVLVDSVEHMSQ